MTTILAYLRTSGVAEIDTFSRPRLLPVHSLTDLEGVVDEKTPYPLLPQELRLTAQSLSSQGAYLMDNGVQIYLRLGLGLSREFLFDVFGIDTLDRVDARKVCLFVSFLYFSFLYFSFILFLFLFLFSVAIENSCRKRTFDFVSSNSQHFAVFEKCSNNLSRIDCSERKRCLGYVVFEFVN